MQNNIRRRYTHIGRPDLARYHLARIDAPLVSLCGAAAEDWRIVDVDAHAELATVCTTCAAARERLDGERAARW